MRINESNSSLQPAIALIGHILRSSTFPTFPNPFHPRAHIVSLKWICSRFHGCISTDYTAQSDISWPQYYKCTQM